MVLAACELTIIVRFRAVYGIFCASTTCFTQARRTCRSDGRFIHHMKKSPCSNNLCGRGEYILTAKPRRGDFLTDSDCEIIARGRTFHARRA